MKKIVVMLYALALILCFTSASTAENTIPEDALEFKNIKISVDGEKIILLNAEDEQIKSIISEGIIYVPIESFITALGGNFTYDAESNQIIIQLSDEDPAEESVKSESGETVAAEPVAAEPTTGETVTSETAIAEPVPAEPTTGEAVTTEIVASEPVIMETAATEIVTTVTATTEPVTGEPATGETATTGIEAPEPVTTENGYSEDAIVSLLLSGRWTRKTSVGETFLDFYADHTGMIAGIIKFSWTISGDAVSLDYTAQGTEYHLPLEFQVDGGKIQLYREDGSAFVLTGSSNELPDIMGK